MTRVKALSVIQCREYVFERHGDSGIAAVKAMMTPEGAAAVYSSALMPTDWVDVVHALDHSRGYDKAFGRNDGHLAREMIRDLTMRHITGLYKSLIVGFSPDEMLERSSRLWNRYYDQGESQLKMLGENRALKRIIGCPDMPKDHDWLITPYYESMLRFAGAREIQVKHMRCVALGAGCCETELRWRPGRPESRSLVP